MASRTTGLNLLKTAQQVEAQKTSTQTFSRPSERDAAADRYLQCRKALHSVGSMAFPQGTGSTRAHVECRNAFNALKSIDPGTAEKLSRVQFPQKSTAQLAAEQQQRQKSQTSSSLPKISGSSIGARPRPQPRPLPMPEVQTKPSAGTTPSAPDAPKAPSGADTDTPDYMQDDVNTTMVPGYEYDAGVEVAAPGGGVMGFVKRNKLMVAGGVVIALGTLYFLTRR